MTRERGERGVFLSMLLFDITGIFRRWRETEEESGRSRFVRVVLPSSRRAHAKSDEKTSMKTESHIMNVLFLCTGNSARSIIAEALTNSLAVALGKFRAYSAGSHPKGAVNPLALDLLRQNRLPTQGLRSKDWEEFSKPDAPVMDFVITVCDKAAGEQCPFWPGQPVTAHWGMPDPAEVNGTDEQKRRAFSDAANMLRRRIELLANLPMDKLDRLALRNKVQEIGKK
jgi:arsenate reductase